MSHSNYTYITTNCPECKTSPVIRDNIRGETYCPTCGLILQDNTLPSITNIISQRETEINEKRMRTIWRTVSSLQRKV